MFANAASVARFLNDRSGRSRMHLYTRVCKQTSLLLGPRWDEIDVSGLHQIATATLRTPMQRWDCGWGRGLVAPKHVTMIDIEDVTIVDNARGVRWPDNVVPALRVVDCSALIAFGAWYWRYTVEWLF